MAALVVTAFLLGDRLQLTGDLVGLLVVAVVFGLINTFIRPLIKLISLPITFITLGLFTLVINMAMLLLTAFLVGDRLSFSGGFLETLVTAFVASLIISVISTVMGWFVRD